jgi:hypothetical protein
MIICIFLLLCNRARAIFRFMCIVGEFIDLNNTFNAYLMHLVDHRLIFVLDNFLDFALIRCIMNALCRDGIIFKPFGALVGILLC